MEFPKNLEILKALLLERKKALNAFAHRVSPALATARNKTLTGLVVAIPLMATLWVVQLAYGFINNLSAPLLVRFGIDWPLVPFFVTLAVFIAVGFMATNVLGQRILEGLENAMLKVPVVATIYTAIKQVIDSFKSFNNMGNFKRVVYVDYPANGARLIGLVTGQFYDTGLREELTSVVIPTSPSPMTGIVMVVPSHKLVDSSLTLEEAMKLIVSAGLVVPKRSTPGEDLAVSDSTAS
jgi:uncharacterized membrane protein